MKISFSSRVSLPLLSFILIATTLTTERLQAQSEVWPTMLYVGSFRVNYDQAIDPFLETHVRFAFDHWNNTGARFQWIYQNPSGTLVPGKAMVVFNYTTDPNYLGQTTRWTYTGTHFIARADVVMNIRKYQDDEFDLSYNTFADPNKYDFESALHHEAGHAAGLEHSPSPSDVMFPTLNRGERKRYPNTADIAQLQSLYP